MNLFFRKIFIFNLLTLFFISLTTSYSIGYASGLSSEAKEPSAKPSKYHLRETRSYICGVTLDGKPIHAYGPKPREGGLGPPLSVEVSPWVKSVKWLQKLEEGKKLEYVFDPDTHSLYVSTSLSKVQGHCHLKNIASVRNPYGGEIRKEGGLFRTNEYSGHYGSKWHDEIRFKLIELMFVKSLTVLHEPWVRDSTVQEKAMSFYLKKRNGDPISEEDYELLSAIREDNIFSRLTNQQLALYQKNFLRKFGNSVLNPNAFVLGICIPWWQDPPSDEIYDQDPESENYYSLKEEFRGKGILDMELYTPEYGFVPPDILEGLIFKFFARELHRRPENCMP